jgi:branched-chain amino acid transport system permease protein
MNAAGLGGDGSDGRILTGIVIVLLLTAATVPFWANSGIVFLSGVVLTEALFAISWNLLFGFTGLVSFGHAAFFAIGAFACGALLKFCPGVPFLAALVLAGGFGGIAAAIVGFIALRRSTGIYFAMLTMALGEVLHISISYVNVLGRDDGLAAVPRPIIELGFTSINLREGDRYYWFLFAAVLLIAAFLQILVRGRIGRSLRAVRDDPDRFAFLGADIQAYRLSAFVVASTVAAMAGAIQVPWTQIVTPEAAGWVHSTEAVLNTLLGGAAAFWGPALGAVIFAGLNFETRTIAGFSELVIGAVLLIIVLAAPNGLQGLLARIDSRLQRRPARARSVPHVQVDN